MKVLLQDYHFAQEERIRNFLSKHFGQEAFEANLARPREAIQPFVEKAKSLGTKIVTIAGTNGKGECAQALAYLCERETQSYSKWMSPHVLTIRERFKKNGHFISYELLEHLILVAHHELQNQKIKLSYYEFLFYVFLKYSLGHDPSQTLILEVGLGGRFDAVNLFDAHLVLISSISRDHQKFLGKTYRKIFFEKAGVIRSHSKVFVNLSTQYLQQLFHEVLQERKCVGINMAKKLQGHDYSKQNQLLAWNAWNNFQHMPSGPFHFSSLPHDWNPPKRRWSFQSDLWHFTFIGPHNTDGMRHAMNHLQGESWDQVWVAFSKRDFEEVIHMLKILALNLPEASPIMICELSHEKCFAWSDEFRAYVQTLDKDMTFVQNYKDLLLHQSHCQKHQKILVLGSYYFIGDVLTHLSARHAKGLPTESGRPHSYSL